MFCTAKLTNLLSESVASETPAGSPILLMAFPRADLLTESSFPEFPAELAVAGSTLGAVGSGSASVAEHPAMMMVSSAILKTGVSFFIFDLSTGGPLSAPDQDDYTTRTCIDGEVTNMLRIVEISSRSAYDVCRASRTTANLSHTFSRAAINRSPASPSSMSVNHNVIGVAQPECDCLVTSRCTVGGPHSTGWVPRKVTVRRGSLVSFDRMGWWTVTNSVPSRKDASTWSSRIISEIPSLMSSRVRMIVTQVMRSDTERPLRAPSSSLCVMMATASGWLTLRLRAVAGAWWLRDQGLSVAGRG